MNEMISLEIDNMIERAKRMVLEGQEERVNACNHIWFWKQTEGNRDLFDNFDALKQRVEPKRCYVRLIEDRDRHFIEFGIGKPDKYVEKNLIYGDYRLISSSLDEVLSE